SPEAAPATQGEGGAAVGRRDRTGVRHPARRRRSGRALGRGARGAVRAAAGARPHLRPWQDLSGGERRDRHPPRHHEAPPARRPAHLATALRRRVIGCEPAARPSTHGTMSCRRAYDLDLAAFFADPRAPELAEFVEHYPRCPECAAEARAWREV